MSERVCVVGAGIVGLACAVRLANAGFEVIVLERRAAGCGATSEAMGHVVTMDDSPAQLALTTLGRQRWREISANLPPSCQWEPRGTLWLAENEAQLEHAARRCETYRAAGIEAELLDASALLTLEPDIAPDLVGAFRIPDDAIVYPPAVIPWLQTLLSRHGGSVRSHAHAQSVQPGGVTLQNGETIEADHIVVSAGVASIDLLSDNTLPVQLKPRRGHLAITDRVEHPRVRHQLVELGYLDSAHGSDVTSIAFNVQPRANGQLLIGSSREFDAEDRAVDQTVLGAMLRRAVRFLPTLATCSIIRTWTGQRPATDDHLPLIGPVPDQPGVWLAAGHEGLGITLAFATADLITAHVTQSSFPLDPSPFLPARTGTTHG